MTNPDELEALAVRLAKRAELEREIAANSRIVADLLKPQREAFKGREGHNVYAVRMQIDHQRSAEKDDAFAADLEQAVALIRTLHPLSSDTEGMVK
jgi:hypothetical protein